MSVLLINDYLRAIARLRQFSDASAKVTFRFRTIV